MLWNRTRKYDTLRPLIFFSVEPACANVLYQYVTCQFRTAVLNELCHNLHCLMFCTRVIYTTKTVLAAGCCVGGLGRSALVATQRRIDLIARQQYG